MNQEITNHIKNNILFFLNNSKKQFVELKKDQSFVTELDLYISNMVYDLFKQHTSSTFFLLDEEKSHDQSELKFPLLVIDPLDGTKEFVYGVNECATSIAFLHSANIKDPKNFAFIYNPFTGLEISTFNNFFPLIKKSNATDFIPSLKEKSCLVSRSEWDKGLFENFKLQNYDQVTPRGSIAFKLGLCAVGACDEIISLQDKNLWDICAGTILLAKRGFNFFEKNKIIYSFNKIRYFADLKWCQDAV